MTFDNMQVMQAFPDAEHSGQGMIEALQGAIGALEGFDFILYPGPDEEMRQVSKCDCCGEDTINDNWGVALKENFEDESEPFKDLFTFYFPHLQLGEPIILKEYLEGLLDAAVKRSSVNFLLDDILNG